jgi:hypothetical protein
MTKPLYLHQELMLLAIDDNGGDFASGMFSYAVAAGMINELLLQHRIQLNDKDDSKVIVVDRRPIGDELLDELFTLINETESEQTLQHWISSAVNIRDLHHRIAHQLCDLGVLKQDEKTVLWIFTRQVYPELDGTVEASICQRMAKVMFDPAASCDEKTLVLIALAKHGNLLNANFPQDRLSQHKDRIDSLARDACPLSEATKATIEAAEAAILVAIMIPTMINT